MPSRLKDAVLALVRVLLTGVGLLIASGIVYGLATMPPAPSDSDGFVTGAAYLVGSIIFVLALGVASLGVVLPSVLGLDDPLGFGHGQRALLKAAVAIVVGGFVLGLLYGLVTQLQFGFFLWLSTVVLGVLVVVLAVGWRVIEALVRAVLRRTDTA